VAFVIAGQLSDRHAQVFAEAGLARKLGLATRGIDDASVLASGLFEEELVEQFEDARSSEAAVLSESKPSTAASPVRAIQTYEHPAVLAEAFDTAKHRIMLLSPWLRSAVVDENFLVKLEAALAKGVEVYLGWGMSAQEGSRPDADKAVLDALSRIAAEQKGFHFKRLGRTHAKVLICDERFVVVTSFNWLSFKGDPKRTFRDERGMMVTLPAAINEQFESLRARFL
jgi:phosphatidylserine/phosphatidylglycerophosphate/cardiolipin synthase-like enzyme